MISARDMGLTVKGSSSGEELVVCPFHHDHSPSAWFNPRKGMFYCSVCHLGLTTELLMYKLGLKIEEVEIGSETSGEPQEYNLFEEQMRLDLGMEYYHPYFEERNISEAAVNTFGVRWCSTRDAAAFTVSSLAGKVTGAVYRNRAGKSRYTVVGETQPIWPMGFLPKIDQKKLLVITEGPFSALRIATVLPDVQTLALMGAKASQKVVEAIRPFQAVVVYDRDSAGCEARLRLRRMAPSIPAYTTNLSPDDRTDSEIENLVGELEERSGFWR